MLELRAKTLELRAKSQESNPSEEKEMCARVERGDAQRNTEHESYIHSLPSLNVFFFDLILACSVTASVAVGK